MDRKREHRTRPPLTSVKGVGRQHQQHLSSMSQHLSSMSQHLVFIRVVNLDFYITEDLLFICSMQHVHGSAENFAMLPSVKSTSVC